MREVINKYSVKLVVTAAVWIGRGGGFCFSSSWLLLQGDARWVCSVKGKFDCDRIEGRLESPGSFMF